MNLGDGVEITDSVNVGQLNEMETNIGKYVKAEIAKVDTGLKKYFNSQLIMQVQSMVTQIL